MDIADLTTLQGIVPALRATSKAQALQELARVAARLAGLEEQKVHKALVEREQLGSTGIGRNVALPHARIPGLTRFIGVFARLEKPIDFDAIDQQPVDLAFVLLCPENAPKEQIAALACVSRLFRDPALCEKLRQTQDTAGLYAILNGRQPPAAR